MAESKKNVRGRMKDREPNPVDVYAGQRMRLRRVMLKMSQQALAWKLGLTFQQVQKYEKGENRIGFSRICDIADVLGTTLDYFRDGMGKKTAENSPMRLVNPPEVEAEEIAEIREEDPLKKTETLELIKNYYKINNRRLSRHIFILYGIWEKAIRLWQKNKNNTDCLKDIFKFKKSLFAKRLF